MNLVKRAGVYRKLAILTVMLLVAYIVAFRKNKSEN